MEITRELYVQVAESSYFKFYGSHLEDAPKSDSVHKHIVEVAASVMMDRDSFIPGGGFVDAVNRNDLAAAVGRADSTCIKHLAFFVYCKNNSHINQN